MYNYKTKEQITDTIIVFENYIKKLKYLEKELI